MTETEWLASTDPVAMLAHLEQLQPGVKKRKRSRRRPRRLAVEFWRWQASNLKQDDHDRLLEAVALADQWAETGVKPHIPGSLRRYFVLGGRAWTVARETLEAAINSGTPRYRLAQGWKVHLRELWGNPFRPSIFEPVWLGWNDGTVVRLAGSVYDDGTFDTMPILGDALEEAGCADVAILEHCRGPGPHVRGCWVLDGLLGK